MNRFRGRRDSASQEVCPQNTPTALHFKWSKDSSDYLIGDISVCQREYVRLDITRMLEILKKCPYYDLDDQTIPMGLLCFLVSLGVAAFIVIIAVASSYWYLGVIAFFVGLYLGIGAMAVYNNTRDMRFDDRKKAIKEAIATMQGSIFQAKKYEIELSPWQTYISLILPSRPGDPPTNPQPAPFNNQQLAPFNNHQPVYNQPAPFNHVAPANRPSQDAQRQPYSQVHPPLDNIDIFSHQPGGGHHPEVLQGIRAKTLVMKTVPIEKENLPNWQGL